MRKIIPALLMSLMTLASVGNPSFAQNDLQQSPAKQSETEKEKFCRLRAEYQCSDLTSNSEDYKICFRNVYNLCITNYQPTPAINH